MERETGFEPATPSLEGSRSSQLSYSRLCHALQPLDPGCRLTGHRFASLARQGSRATGPSELLRGWWGEEDSNLRRHEPTDLQSAPFGRLGISPEPVGPHHQMADSAEAPRHGGAGGGNRTPDRLITNQLLYLLSYASRQTSNILLSQYKDKSHAAG